PPSSLSLDDSFAMVFHMISSFLNYPRALLRYLFLIRTLGPRYFARVLTSWSQVSHIYAREPCNRVAVMGPYAKRIFTQLGYDDGDVVVTGQPRFDALKSPYEPREAVCRKLGIDDSHRILLFAAPVFRSPERRSVFVRPLVRSIKEIGDLALVIKVHPREDPGPYQEILRAEGARETSVVTDFPVPSLLHACDLFLSNYSTMTLEALLVGRPVILLKTRDESAAYPFDNVAVTVAVDDGGGLTAAIRDVLGSGESQGDLTASRDRFVREHANGGDGQASQRVAALIRDLCLVQPT
ncbi:MAG: CDP-glycerol glycerophosphotransferase family protein, partial [Thermoplasmata archaeon]